MMSIQHVRRHLSRLVLASVALAALSIPAGPGASAEQKGGDASTNATTMIQVCEAMGGHATVYSDMSSTHYTVIVECDGGALDGLNCIFDEAMVDCYQTRLSPVDDTDVVEVDEIAPLPEPTRELPEVVVDVPIEDVAPVEVEPTETPTPDPVVDPVIDPVVDPVQDDPVVNDGGAAPEPTAGPVVDGIKDGLPGITIDPSLVAPAEEQTEVVPLETIPDIQPVVLT